MTNEEEQRARMKAEIDEINAVNQAGRDGKIAFEQSLEDEPYKNHLYQEMRFDELLIIETREMHQTLRRIENMLAMFDKPSYNAYRATLSESINESDQDIKQNSKEDSEALGDADPAIREVDPAVNEVDPSQTAALTTKKPAKKYRSGY